MLFFLYVDPAEASLDGCRWWLDATSCHPFRAEMQYLLLPAGSLWFTGDFPSCHWSKAGPHQFIAGHRRKTNKSCLSITVFCKVNTIFLKQKSCNSPKISSCEIHEDYVCDSLFSVQTGRYISGFGYLEEIFHHFPFTSYRPNKMT